jgi:hypothetical protein
LEIRDCCGSERAQGHHNHSHHHHHHMHNGNSRTASTSLETSLESLSRHHQHHNHPGSSSSSAAASGAGKGTTTISSSIGIGLEEEDEEEEAKYWYCDSDCEDCDEDPHHNRRPCRSSLLVRTIGGEDLLVQGESSGRSGSKGCASTAATAACECNSCLAEEEDDDDEEDDEDCVDGSGTGINLQNHKNTPSMASETTLKAAEGINSSCDMGKEVIDVEVEAAEEYKLEDEEEDEHVYGEISEDLPLKSGSGVCSRGGGSNSSKDIKTEEEYSTIEEAEISVAPKPKPRKLMYSCIKSVEPQKSGCKCRVKDKCCSAIRQNNGGVPVCTKINKDKLVVCSASSSSASKNKCHQNGPAAASSNGLTPKVASLKCLRKVHHRERSSGNQQQTSNVKRVTSSRDVPIRQRERLPHPPPPMNYVEFGEKIQQGRYPSTRTVSDNFDTDSDYVQLPPLSWYPPPPKPPPKNGKKLWKFLDSSALKDGSNSSSSGKSPTPPPPEVNINTLPRRKTSCDAGSPQQAMLIRQRIQKVSSRSTTAINLLGQSSSSTEKRPEPPPKPRKSLADLSTLSDDAPPEDGILRDGNGNAIDARFIATKPQILIQTAYATTAPVAIPSQAQVLVRGAKLGAADNYGSGGLLQHSQSVDNIYDTVASEDIILPQFLPTSMSPPPYPSNQQSQQQQQHPPLIMRPGNYIDVHASGKGKKSQKSQVAAAAMAAAAAQQQTNAYIAAALGNGKGMGLGVANRCGSMPNNLNNFLIGLQNLKPLSRTPIVHPGPGASTSSCLTLNQTPNGTSSAVATSGQVNTTTTSSAQPPASSSAAARFTTVYTNQLTRSQIQQFKAQLYSDLDYVIFPQKDPRVSQQEYFDSKSLSYTTVSSTTNSNPMLTTSSVSAYQISDIPPPYLPPPPPYPSTAVVVASSATSNSNIPPPLPRKNPKKPAQTNVTSSLSSHSITTASHHHQNNNQPYHHASFQSLYNPGGSNCSSSQYGGGYGGSGYYGATTTTNNNNTSSVGGLNAENLQRFLSTQSFAASTSNCSNNGGAGSSSIGGGAIYYPSSTQSAPPLPPYKKSSGSHHHQQQQQQQVIIENGMRKAIQQQLASIASRNGRRGLILSDERLRMKLCRSEESLYSQPTQEEHLQAIYNLPPPPPYKGTVRSNSHLSRPQVSFNKLFSKKNLLIASCNAKDELHDLLRCICILGINVCCGSRLS